MTGIATTTALILILCGVYARKRRAYLRERNHYGNYVIMNDEDLKDSRISKLLADIPTNYPETSELLKSSEPYFLLYINTIKKYNKKTKRKKRENIIFCNNFKINGQQEQYNNKKSGKLNN